MNTFLITANIKGLDTKIVVEEPPQWDVPEFAVSINNPALRERFSIRLHHGLRERLPVNSTSSLEPLEVEHIGLEIAKCWRTRLSKTLDLFEQLF
ncbi:MAG: hypothetical protein JWN56_1315 [Sphingobacteriales bacterium]|nr:hypothetical protein [Sphingobacteriales bacterium]